MKYRIGGAWGCDHAPSGLCNLIECHGYATCVLARPAAKPLDGRNTPGHNTKHQNPSDGYSGGADIWPPPQIDREP